MIYFVTGPITRHIQPCQSMAFMGFSVNRSGQISVGTAAAGNIADFSSGLFKPADKYADNRVVEKYRFKPCLGKHIAPHQSESHRKARHTMMSRMSPVGLAAR